MLATTEDKREQRRQAYLKKLEEKAQDLENQAVFAEKEAQLRKRIADARARINANGPPPFFSFSSLLGKFPRGGNRVAIVLIALVIVILLVVKAC